MKKRKGLSKLGIFGFGCLGLIVLIFIIAAASGSKTNTSNQKTSQDPTHKSPATEESKSSLDLSFKAIDAIFGTQSDITDLQKQEKWTQYKGQKINWVCSVVSVKEAFLSSGYTLNAKCNPSTFTSDTSVEFGSNWKEKLLTFKEKDIVTFSGSLGTYGMLGYSIKNGEIK